ncbi:MAG: hypothetical protein LBI10_12785 [Deltaproteobacteria bacterium]|jgi:hypothetical protein|nr:hypothetical protein [Deltaproteobacteria bacterium]
MIESGLQINVRVIISLLDTKKDKLIPNFYYFYHYDSVKFEEPGYRSVWAFVASFFFGLLIVQLKGIGRVLDETFGMSRFALIKTVAIYMTHWGEVFNDARGVWKGGSVLNEPLLTFQERVLGLLVIDDDEKLAFLKFG